MHKRPNTFHPLWIAIILIIILWLFFHPTLVSDKLFISDGLIPGDFNIDWWSNYIFSGFPLIADPTWHLFYLIKYLIYKIFKLDFNYFIVSGYFLMAYFTYGYVYFFTKNKLSSLASGLLFCFSGYSIFEIGHAVIFIHTICWLPLVLLAFEKLKMQYSAFWTMLAVFGVVMSIAGGFPQLSIAVNVIFITYVIFLATQSNKKIKTLLFYYGILFIGYLISTPIIIPTLVHTQFTNRDNITWEMFASYYVEIKQLLLFVFPYLMGGYYGAYPGVPSFGNWEIVGNHGYVGFLTLVFGGVSLYKGKGILKNLKNYWLFCSLMSLLIALGPTTRIFYKTLYYLPIINHFRAPERYLFVFSFGLSVLAGLGIDAIQKGYVNLRKEKNKIILATILFVLLLIILVIKSYPSIQQMSTGRIPIQLPNLWVNCAFIIPMMWIIISLVALTYWLMNTNSLPRMIFAVTIMISEVMFTAYFSYWHPELGRWNKDDLNNTPIFVEDLKDKLNLTHQRYLSIQVNADIGNSFSFNGPLYHKIPSAGGYIPLAIIDYLNFLQISDYGIYIGKPNQLENNQAINITGIKYILSSTFQENKVLFKDSSRFILIDKVNNLLVYENLKVLPRAWFTQEVMQLDRNKMLAIIHSSKFEDGTLFDPNKTALIEKKLNSDLKQSKSNIVNIRSIKSQKIEIDTQNEAEGFLILSDVYYPNWYAYIDGKQTEIYRTDYIYRGVVVPKGNHNIRFVFKPYHLFICICTSIVTMIMLIIFILNYEYSKRQLIPRRSD